MAYYFENELPLSKAVCRFYTETFFSIQDEEKDGKCYSGMKPEKDEITSGMKKECGDMEIVFVRLGDCPDKKGREIEIILHVSLKQWMKYGMSKKNIILIK